MKIGNLNIVPALENLNLVPIPVAEMIKLIEGNESIGVVEIDPSFSDTAGFCEHFQVNPEITCNCVIIEAKRGEKRQLVACVILAITRADINGVARRALDARKASFAPMDEAVEKSGMEYGGITPVGLPEDWAILIDSKIITLDYVVIGGGNRKSKIIIPGKVLANLPNAQVLEGLGK